jgi:hypothetical protein
MTRVHVPCIYRTSLLIRAPMWVACAVCQGGPSIPNCPNPNNCALPISSAFDAAMNKQEMSMSLQQFGQTAIDMEMPSKSGQAAGQGLRIIFKVRRSSVRVSVQCRSSQLRGYIANIAMRRIYRIPCHRGQTRSNRLGC